MGANCSQFSRNCCANEKRQPSSAAVSSYATTEEDRQQGTLHLQCQFKMCSICRQFLDAAHDQRPSLPSPRYLRLRCRHFVCLECIAMIYLENLPEEVGEVKCQLCQEAHKLSYKHVSTIQQYLMAQDEQLEYLEMQPQLLALPFLQESTIIAHPIGVSLRQELGPGPATNELVYSAAGESIDKTSIEEACDMAMNYGPERHGLLLAIRAADGLVLGGFLPAGEPHGQEPPFSFLFTAESGSCDINTYALGPSDASGPGLPLWSALHLDEDCGRGGQENTIQLFSRNAAPQRGTSLVTTLKFQIAEVEVYRIVSGGDNTFEPPQGQQPASSQAAQDLPYGSCDGTSSSQVGRKASRNGQRKYWNSHGETQGRGPHQGLKTSCDAKTNCSDVRHSFCSTSKNTTIDHRNRVLNRSDIPTTSALNESPQHHAASTAAPQAAGAKFSLLPSKQHEIINVAQLLDSEKKGLPWQSNLIEVRSSAQSDPYKQADNLKSMQGISQESMDIQNEHYMDIKNEHQIDQIDNAYSQQQNDHTPFTTPVVNLKSNLRNRTTFLGNDINFPRQSKKASIQIQEDGYYYDPQQQNVTNFAMTHNKTTMHHMQPGMINSQPNLMSLNHQAMTVEPAMNIEAMSAAPPKKKPWSPNAQSMDPFAPAIAQSFIARTSIRHQHNSSKRYSIVPPLHNTISYDDQTSMSPDAVEVAEDTIQALKEGQVGVKSQRHDAFPVQYEHYQRVFDRHYQGKIVTIGKKHLKHSKTGVQNSSVHGSRKSSNMSVGHHRVPAGQLHYPFVMVAMNNSTIEKSESYTEQYFGMEVPTSKSIPQISSFKD